MTYCFLLVFRTPVDTVLCIMNALFLRNVFQNIAAGDAVGCGKALHTDGCGQREYQYHNELFHQRKGSFVFHTGTSYLIATSV